jgi:2-methylisocitrate lyase-like PEP mutase family enzyme
MNRRAETFRGLHAPGELLILPNAWDAGSARIIESCGATAIATSSAAVAWALGYPDGNALPPRMLTRTIETIVRVIDVPLTVDSEAGYSDDPTDAAENVAAFANAGAVGINIEDGSDSPDLLCAKIEEIKKRVPDLFVNARIDVLLRKLASPESSLDEIAARAHRYRDAGADGIFVPMIAGFDDIRAVVERIAPLPLNVMAIPSLPPASELRRLGVRRLSAGAGIGRAALGLIRELATPFLREGDSARLLERADLSNFNAMFDGR